MSRATRAMALCLAAAGGVLAPCLAPAQRPTTPRTAGAAVPAAPPAEQPMVTLSLGDGGPATVAPGARVAVPLRVDLGRAGRLTFAAVQGTVRWDTAHVRLDSVRAAPGAGFTVTANLADAPRGVARFNAFSPAALPASGAVVLFHLVAGTRPGCTPVRLEVEVAGTEEARPLGAALRSRGVELCVAAGAPRR